jgi:hypothetical protein
MSRQIEYKNNKDLLSAEKQQQIQQQQNLKEKTNADLIRNDLKKTKLQNNFENFEDEEFIDDDDDDDDDDYNNQSEYLNALQASDEDEEEEEEENDEEDEEESDVEFDYDYDIEKKIELIQESSNLKLRQFHQSKHNQYNNINRKNDENDNDDEVAQLNSNIVHEILCEQDLSRAGCLFTFSNELLLKDFSTTIAIIKNIIDQKSYLENLNEQSIVEIVLTKCISALRETKMINKFYDDILDLLEICLKYDLNNNRSNRSSSIYKNDCGATDNEPNDDTTTATIGANTPHANIVSDVLSSILLVSYILFI